MGRPVQAPELLSGDLAHVRQGAQRMFNSLTQSVNELNRKLTAATMDLQHLEYWVSNNDWRQARISTTDATETTLAAYTMVDDRVWLMEALVAAREHSGADRAYFHIEGLFYREGASAAQQGLTISSVNLESDYDWDCDFDVDDADVRIRVTGELATDVDWRSWVRFREYKA